MKIIKSNYNQEIKTIEKLQTTKGRKDQGKFIAEGIRICSALISANAQLVQLYVTEKMKDFAFGFAKEHEITIVPENIMKKISSADTPSGLLGVFKIPKTPTIDTLTEGMVLAQISDPGNMGTLIRSCAAMGVKNVVLVEGADIWSPKVVQSSVGTVINVNIFQISWPELIKNKNRLKFCALTVSGGKNPKDIDFKDTLLVVGNEAHGLPQQWIDQCDEKMTIPMPGEVESLNAAIAGSIAMYLAFAHKKA